MKTLITGIDTLDMGYCVEQYICYADMFGEIEEAKKKAGIKEVDGVINIYGRDFVVLPFGSGRHNYILVNQDMTIKICKNALGGKHYSEVKIYFRSQYLWNGYWYDKVKEVEDWLKQWAQVNGSKASRCDLTTDIEADLPIFDTQYSGLITRSKLKTDFKIDRHARGRRNTGYSFGKGNLICRIYPKDYEVKLTHKEYFYPLWEARGWDNKLPVTRVEFQNRRDLLRKWSMNTIEDIRDQSPDLWKYESEKWISIRVPGKDVKHHANRWPYTEFWNEVIKSGKIFGELSGVTMLSPGQPKAEHLIKQMLGCASSAEAYTGIDIQREFLERLKSKEYKETVEKKSYRLGRYN